MHPQMNINKKSIKKSIIKILIKSNNLKIIKILVKMIIKQS